MAFSFIFFAIILFNIKIRIYKKLKNYKMASLPEDIIILIFLSTDIETCAKNNRFYEFVQLYNEKENIMDYADMKNRKNRKL